MYKNRRTIASIIATIRFPFNLRGKPLPFSALLVNLSYSEGHGDFIFGEKRSGQHN